MARKFYAVKVGRKTGVFDNWEECKEQVDGFNGAEYKAFKSYDECYKYFDDESDGAEQSMPKGRNTKPGVSGSPKLMLAIDADELTRLRSKAEIGEAAEMAFNWNYSFCNAEGEVFDDVNELVSTFRYLKGEN